MCSHSQRTYKFLARSLPLWILVLHAVGTMSDTVCGNASFEILVLLRQDIAGRSLDGSRKRRTARRSRFVSTTSGHQISPMVLGDSGVVCTDMDSVACSVLVLLHQPILA